MRRHLLLGLATTLALAPTACSSESAEAICETPEPTTTVQVVDFDYVPPCVEAAPGDTLTIENTSEAPHTYTVGVVDLQVDVAAGETAELTLEGVEAGATYDITCVYHPQMTGALRIV